MNAQPIYPEKPRVTVRCSHCGERVDSLYGYADLDAPAGTYLCPPCAPIGSYLKGHRTHRHLEGLMFKAGADLDNARDNNLPREALTQAHANACDRYHGFHY